MRTLHCWMGSLLVLQQLIWIAVIGRVRSIPVGKGVSDKVGCAGSVVNKSQSLCDEGQTCGVCKAMTR